jgi:DnaD/phage-associated family protein
MAWTRIDDKFLNNIKIQKAGALGMSLYLAGLIHCNTNLTDGFIDEEILPMLYGLSFQTPRNKSVERLVELKLWHRVDGGYEVNDFLDFNRSKSQIEIIKEKRAESGSKGGRISQAKDKQIAKQIAKQINKQTLEQNPSINTLSPNPLTHKDLKKPPPLLDAHDDLVDSIVKTYEQEIGKLTPAVIDDILAVIEDYPLEWFEEAFKEASRNNKPNWRYALAILKRWKIDGYKVDTRTKRSNNGRNAKVPDMGGYEVDRTSEVVIIDNGEAFDGELQF